LASSIFLLHVFPPFPLRHRYSVQPAFHPPTPHLSGGSPFFLLGFYSLSPSKAPFAVAANLFSAIPFPHLLFHFGITQSPRLICLACPFFSLCLLFRMAAYSFPCPRVQVPGSFSFPPRLTRPSPPTHFPSPPPDPLFARLSTYFSRKKIPFFFFSYPPHEYLVPLPPAGLNSLSRRFLFLSVEKLILPSVQLPWIPPVFPFPFVGGAPVCPPVPLALSTDSLFSNPY